MPQKTYQKKGLSTSGCKQHKQRVSVLLCCNASGTDKIEPFVIGHFKKPRCFKSINSLPVGYDANRNAWMTKEIFNNWVKAWDNALVKDKRKICLCLDNCTAHRINFDPKAIKIAYLPSNTTSILQPLDQGIIKNFKAIFRKQLISKIISFIDDDGGESVNQILEEINLLDALFLIRTAWDNVGIESIVNTFKKVGFQVEKNDISDSEDEISYENQLSDSEIILEENELIVVENDTPDIQQLIASHKSEFKDVTEEQTDESGISSENKNRVTSNQIFHAISILKQALATYSIPKYVEVMELESEFSFALAARLKQRKISEYLAN